MEDIKKCKNYYSYRQFKIDITVVFDAHFTHHPDKKKLKEFQKDFHACQYKPEYYALFVKYGIPDMNYLNIREKDKAHTKLYKNRCKFVDKDKETCNARSYNKYCDEHQYFFHKLKQNPKPKYNLSFGDSEES